ncbi:NAD-dependent epimerase/dehydratase family protein [Streptomyces sp. HM190]|uniref:NAD-dependent epimerase/dehydratase family protein n=1 Tax=Streptomyces sp. HM190 TaxID=2695266 RepID=UPI00135CE175|nr:SDR family NAD(P)-dependent oxidoreductase [Streptomyces sp. HM190]
MSARAWADRTVVVTGGTGFIGSHVVEELLARQAHVICLYRTDDRHRLAQLPVTKRLLSVRVDLCDETALRRVFDGAERGVDTVVHCAAMWGRAGFRYDHPATVFEANFRPAANVLKCARDHGTSDVVLLGSGEVYRSSATRPLKEEDDFRTGVRYATDGYYLAKLYEEMLADTYRHEHGMNVFRPRLTGVYGPRDNFAPGADRVIPAMLARAAADQEIVIWGDGSQTRTYMFVTDLVHAVLRMVEKNTHHTVNMGTSETVSMRQLAHLVCAVLGKPDRITFDREKPTGRSSRTLDLTRLGGIIDFRPRGLREGLEQTADWYRKRRISARPSG